MVVEMQVIVILLSRVRLVCHQEERLELLKKMGVFIFKIVSRVALGRLGP